MPSPGFSVSSYNLLRESRLELEFLNLRHLEIRIVSSGDWEILVQILLAASKDRLRELVLRYEVLPPRNELKSQNLAFASLENIELLSVTELSCRESASPFFSDLQHQHLPLLSNIRLGVLSFSNFADCQVSRSPDIQPYLKFLRLYAENVYSTECTFHLVHRTRDCPFHGGQQNLELALRTQFSQALEHFVGFDSETSTLTKVSLEYTDGTDCPNFFNETLSDAPPRYYLLALVEHFSHLSRSGLVSFRFRQSQLGDAYQAAVEPFRALPLNERVSFEEFATHEKDKEGSPWSVPPRRVANFPVLILDPA